MTKVSICMRVTHRVHLSSAHIDINCSTVIKSLVIRRRTVSEDRTPLSTQCPPPATLSRITRRRKETGHGDYFCDFRPLEAVRQEDDWHLSPARPAKFPSQPLCQTLSQKRSSRQDGSAGKVLAAWAGSSEPKHRRGKNRLHKGILWPPHTHHGVWEHRCACVCVCVSKK